MAKCALCIEPDLVLLCGSTDFSDLSNFRELERNFNVSARSLLTSLARNISICHFFLLVCSIFLKCRPAAANATVRSRERELRQAGAQRVSFRPCLSGFASPESLRGRALECRRRRSGWSVTSSSRLVFSSSSLRCRAIRFFTEHRRGSHARSDGAAAFGDRKI